MTARVGIDIGGTKMLALAHDRAGETLGERRFDTGPSTDMSSLVSCIREFAASLPVPVDALGLAVPGLVDQADGRVEMSDVLPQLNGWQPRDLLGTGVPHVIVNDIRAALAQSSRSLRPDATVAVMIAGTAIGMACVTAGRVISGATGWAGEIGSVPVVTPSGIRRLDDLAGGAAILAELDQPAETIHAALAVGDVRATDVVRSAGETFGLAIATVINLFNPEMIEIAGGTLRYEGYAGAALRMAEQWSLPPLWRTCTVRRAADADKIVALGALHLAAR